MISKKKVASITSITPITAYRYWRLNIKEKNIFLRSLLANQIWIPHQKVIARHSHGKYEKHGEYEKRLVYDSSYGGCDYALSPCGIHAWKEPPHVSRRHLMGEVFGKVLLWGFVREGTEDTEGYQAQYAYPLEITNIYCRGCYIEMLLPDKISFFSRYLSDSYNSYTFYRAYPYCQRCAKQHILCAEESFMPIEDMTVKDLLHHLNNIYSTDQAALY